MPSQILMGLVSDVCGTKKSTQGSIFGHAADECSIHLQLSSAVVCVDVFQNCRALSNLSHPYTFLWLRYNVVVVGAGTGGLVAAAGSAGVGAKVAIIEEWMMGGDCLNVGCVPSKAIIRSAHHVYEVAP